jgi:NAD(P)-dependent dehydrogenase (short-subunit alcohol dehydrogenase family)
MSTSIDTGKTETVAKSAETNEPIGGAPLAGKIAIITGGGRGMGRSMVLGLARAGAKVIATAARERQELERVVAEAPRTAVVPIVADVTDADNCAELVAETLRRFGKLDILVNNAGRGMRYVSEDFLTEPTRFWETDPKAWQLIIDTNVNGPFFMARAAAPPMIKAGWGRIINHSANFLTMRRRGFSPYGPSKAALESETQIWAQELAGTGVTVNAILPGRRNLDRNGPEILSRGRAETPARSRHHRPALALSGERGIGRTHGQTFRCEQMAERSTCRRSGSALRAQRGCLPG